MGEDVYLEDKLLNVFHNLKQSAYSFATTAGTFDNRFVLRYNDGTALGNDDHELENDDLIAYKSETGIVVKSKNSGLEKVVLYDVAGRRLFGPHGLIIAKITLEGNRVLQRKIIN